MIWGRCLEGGSSGIMLKISQHSNLSVVCAARWVRVAGANIKDL